MCTNPIQVLKMTQTLTYIGKFHLKLDNLSHMFLCVVPFPTQQGSHQGHIVQVGSQHLQQYTYSPGRLSTPATVHI